MAKHAFQHKDGTLYPIVEDTLQSKIALRAFNATAPTHGRTMAQDTGEYRPRRSGDWFVSGAVHEAYYQHYDDPPNERWHIARLVKVFVDKKVKVLP